MAHLFYSELYTNLHTLFKLLGMELLNFVIFKIMARHKGQKDDPIITRKLKNGEFLTYKDRVTVSEILKSNNYNIRETSRQLGVNEDQIKEWHRQVQESDYASVDAEKVEYAVAVNNEVQTALAQRNSRFIERAYTIKEMALTRLKDLIPESDSVRDMVAAIKVLHEIEHGGKMSEQDEKELAGKPKNMLMEIAAQTIEIVNTNKGKKNGKRKAIGGVPERDSAE